MLFENGGRPLDPGKSPYECEFGDQQVYSMIGAPLRRIDGSVIGVIRVSSSNQWSLLNDDDKAILEAFAGALGQVLQRFVRAEEQDLRQKRLEGILAASRRMMNAPDVNTALRIALTTATYQHGVGFCRSVVPLSDGTSCRMKHPLVRGAASWDEQQSIWLREAATDIELACEEFAKDIDFGIDRPFYLSVSRLEIPNLA